MKLEKSGPRASIFHEIGLEETDPPLMVGKCFTKMSSLERIDEDEEPTETKKSLKVLQAFVEKHMFLFGAIAIVFCISSLTMSFSVSET
jgi:hypothetical protein